MMYILLFFIFLCGNIVRIPLYSSAAISFIDIGILLLVIINIPYIISQRHKIITTPLFRSSALFIMTAFMSLIIGVPALNHTTIIIASMYLIRLILYLSLLFIPFSSTPKKIAVLIMLFLTSGLAQYFLYPDLRNLFYLGWDEHYFRLFGTLLDPNFTGALFVLMLAYVLASMNKLAPKSPWRSTWALLGIGLCAGILLTYSRSAYLTCVVMLTTYAVVQKKLKFIAVFFVLFIIGIALLPKNLPSEGVDLLRTASIRARQKEYSQALLIIKKHPILGVGYNTYRDAQERYRIDTPSQYPAHATAGVPNTYLFILATTGIIGFVAFLWWIRALWQTFIVPSPEYIPLFIAYLFSGLFDNTLVYPFIMMWVFLVLQSSRLSQHRTDNNQRNHRVRDAK